MAAREAPARSIEGYALASNEAGGKPAAQRTPAERPAEIERVTLNDASVVELRQIRPDDKASLNRGFARLGAASRRRRFFAAKGSLSRRELAYFTEVDHDDHEAIVAVDAGGELLGVARYVREGHATSAAEVAVAVIDEWQGRGLATALLRDLVRRARAAGIKHFSAWCLTENRDAIDLLERLGSTRRDHPEPGVTGLSIELSGQADGGTAMRAALREAAAGRVAMRPMAPGREPG